MAKKSKAKPIEFVLDEVGPVSSAEPVITAEIESKVRISQEPAAKVDLQKRSAAFQELAIPELPVLEKQNRARLLIQSPNRIFFYWSLRVNPFQSMSRFIGTEAASYTLALRLLDLETEREELHAIEPEGSWWFNTEAGRRYRAEIGFYSPSRPFIRILFSNTVATPRKSPSRRAAADAVWRVGASKFAEVLDVSGFEKDAFDVAIAGDDLQTAEDTAYSALRQFIGNENVSLDDVLAEEIRYVLLAIASGRSLEEFRWKIGSALFAILQVHAARLAAEKASDVLNEYFEIDEAEFDEEEYSSVVFGNSLVNFPTRFKTRIRPEYSPVSSHSNF